MKWIAFNRGAFVGVVMSLESLVKKSPWYSKLTSRIIAPLAFGLASIFGCSYDNSKVVPIDKSHIQKESVPNGLKDPFSSFSSDPDTVEPVSSAQISAAFCFSDKDSDPFYKFSVDDYVRVMQSLRSSSSNVAEVLKFDEEDDGVFDDRFSMIGVGHFSDQYPESKDIFEFPQIKEKVDSELIYPLDEIYISHVMNFQNSALRDSFVSYVNKMPVAFGRLIDLVKDYCGDDDVFDSSEVEALKVQIDSAIKTGRMKAGRGSISISEEENAGKIEIWNAYVSPIFKISGSSKGVSDSKGWLLEAGVNFYDPVSYDSLILAALNADSGDSKIDGIISAESIKSARDSGKSKLDSKSVESQFSDLDRSRLKSWPIYNPTVKFGFYSKLDRDRFVKHMVDLPISTALVANIGLMNAGADGIFQKTEVDDAINEAERLAKEDYYAVGQDGSIFPSRTNSLPAAYITSVIDVGYNGDWKRNASIFFELIRRVEKKHNEAFYYALSMDWEDGLCDDRIKIEKIMDYLNGEFRDLKEEIISSVSEDKGYPKGPVFRTFNLEEVCLNFTECVFFETPLARDNFIKRLSDVRFASGHLFNALYESIGADFVFGDAEIEKFFGLLPKLSYDARNERTRIEDEKAYFENRLRREFIQDIHGILTVEYHIRQEGGNSTLKELVDYCVKKKKIFGDEFNALLRHLDAKDGNVDGDISARVVRAYVGGAEVNGIDESLPVRQEVRSVDNYDVLNVDYRVFFSSETDLRDFVRVVESTKVSKAGIVYIWLEQFGIPTARHMPRIIESINAAEAQEAFRVSDEFGEFKYTLKEN